MLGETIKQKSAFLAVARILGKNNRLKHNSRSNAVIQGPHAHQEKEGKERES